MRPTCASRSAPRPSSRCPAAAACWSASSMATRTCSASRRSTSSERSHHAERKSPAPAGLFSWAPPATERRRRGSEAPLRLLAQRQQRGVATGGGGIDGDRLLGSEPRQVVRPASLRTGTRKALAAKRLHADHRADLVAVDVAVADLDPRGDLLYRLVDARVHAERQPVTGRVDRVDD